MRAHLQILNAGPWYETAITHGLIMEQINITSMNSNRRAILARRAHASFFQEHSLHPKQHAKPNADLRKAKKRLLLSGVDPYASVKACGWVGVSVAAPRNIINV